MMGKGNFIYHAHKSGYHLWLTNVVHDIQFVSVYLQSSYKQKRTAASKLTNGHENKI